MKAQLLPISDWKDLDENIPVDVLTLFYGTLYNYNVPHAELGYLSSRSRAIINQNLESVAELMQIQKYQIVTDPDGDPISLYLVEEAS